MVEWVLVLSLSTMCLLVEAMFLWCSTSLACLARTLVHIARVSLLRCLGFSLFNRAQ